MAVQGATPSRIMPAMYCCASAGDTHPAKTNSKKNTPRVAMVKGLMSQFTSKVSARPRGRRPTPRTALQSIWTIIG